MKLSHSHKFLFIAIPKTGTTSVGNILANFSSKVGRYKGDQHVTYSFLKESLKTKLDFDEYFKFSVVRNPWDRLVSVFHFLNINNESTELVAPRTRNRLFNRHIKKYKGNFKDFVRGVDIDQILHTREQYSFVCNDKYDIELNFICKLENLQEDFDTICDKIKIPPQQLPHKNKSKHKHYSEYYDEETKSIVAEKYAKDIEYFGYKFGEDL